MYGIPTFDGERAVHVDGRDVARWRDTRATPDPADPEWQDAAAGYVLAHPRPASGHAEAQRLALLRRLAAGPVATEEALAGMRTVGWVGSSDLENRLRELRGRGRGAGAGGLPLASEHGRHWLTQPLPLLDEAQSNALGFAKAMTARLDGPMAAASARALDDLLPGLAPTAQAGPPFQPSLAALEAFHTAMTDRRPARVRYASRNTGITRHLDVVPIEYVTLGGAVKAICVQVDAEGGRAGNDRQLALERLIEVQALTEWASPDADVLEPVRDRLLLVVPDGLRRVIQERDLFGAAATPAVPVEGDLDAYVLQGSFPRALSWDVMEQLCAWAGSVQVREPLWLVNAVCRRLRAGLREMETAAGFDLVKPDPDAGFSTHLDAVTWEPPEQAADPRGLARRVAPPR